MNLHAKTLQRRLAAEGARLAQADALNTWTRPIGSAVFAIPPGVHDGQFLGQGLFE